MTLRLIVFSRLILSMVSTTAGADPSKPKTLKADNSKCIVKATGGEYPMYTVLKDGKPIYAPQSDGVVNALFSPSGKYVALFGSEVGLLDIEKDKFEYGVVIVNCQTGKRTGYRKGTPTLIKGWWEGDGGLDLLEGLDFNEHNGTTLP